MSTLGYTVGVLGIFRIVNAIMLLLNNTKEETSIVEKI